MNVEINLNLVSIPNNTLSSGLRPCPRVNIYKHPIDPEDITQAGEYIKIFNLDPGERCGIDVFGWQNNDIQIIAPNFKISNEIVGENKDQIKKSISITKGGKYTISIIIY